MSDEKLKVTKKLKDKVKSAFLRAYTSKDVLHPLFGASKTETKRLLLTKQGLRELSESDPVLHRKINQYVKDNKLTAREFGKQLDRWTSQLKVRTGETKSVHRKPTKVYHTLSKSGRISRPLDVIQMDLADVNRLNPDKRKYRYPFILVAVDAFSNYTVLVPVKSKSAKHVLNAIKNVFSQMGVDKRIKREKRALAVDRKSGGGGKKRLLDNQDKEKRWCLISTRLQTDRGSEFMNNTLIPFLKKNRMTIFNSRGSGKAYLAESKIGQMKNQLIRIQQTLERNIEKVTRKKRGASRKTTTKIYAPLKAGRHLNEEENQEYTESEVHSDFEFEDWVEYKTGWSQYLKVLQKKLNNKKNLKTGYSPMQLFTQFNESKTPRAASKFDWDRRYAVNETEKEFEPAADTLIKLNLLRKGGEKATRQQISALETAKLKSQRRDKNKAWNEDPKIGDRVYLTYSRLNGHPNDMAINVFEKKSTQTKSRWDTGRPYVVSRIVSGGNTNTPNRYQVTNEQTKLPRKTLYYREELLVDRLSKKKHQSKKTKKNV